MNLYLHNFLQDTSDGKIHYPLKIIVEEKEEVEVEYDESLMLSLARKIDYMGLESACKDLGIPCPVPADIENPTPEELQALQKVLLGIHIKSGNLVSDNGKKFLIVEGIPDMATPDDDEEEDQQNAEE
ncbi:hypothetical protein TVAG_317290 [Trichomonas vaginalis G3]|uniref:Uncharacterized protein n=1 Tax=Trichomonas vaginalis (strain ATCC PRA-98 / G3) TaxID=412133 RepID=A2FR04_TRIV3|nr:Trm112p-like protein family [Trichomonas vaginalis G3]EAX92671.1 hypothetical protein TVAG_317290 [Trichomonas vaginalis G3]KAI5512064.1 Trm112p-like protein family [Trichomonas vaginalis G3]|eukprot:XP_001305601.1 hypothetical protein [Trichomonas vaginalis G3]